MWVPLMEKAYAKLHGGYKNIESGHTTYGIRDLVGSVPEATLGVRALRPVTRGERISFCYLSDHGTVMPLADEMKLAQRKPQRPGRLNHLGRVQEKGREHDQTRERAALLARIFKEDKRVRAERVADVLDVGN